MSSEVFLPGQNPEAFSQDFLMGRIIHCNTMLHGIGVRDEQHRNYNFLKSVGVKLLETNNAKPVDLQNMKFEDLWNHKLLEKLHAHSQIDGLDLVQKWMNQAVEKTILETASCNAFLATGNSFDWGKDPELFTEMTNSVVLIGKAHRDLQNRE